MTENFILTQIKAVEEWIKNELDGENSCIDWSHISRARKMSKAIAKINKQPPS